MTGPGDEPRAERRMVFDRTLGKIVPATPPPPPPSLRPASVPAAPPLPRLTPVKPVSTFAPAARAVLRAAAESLKHLHVIVLAVVGLGGIITSAVLWATSRASDAQLAALRVIVDKHNDERVKAEAELRTLFQGAQDAGAQEQAAWWDQQDEINQSVAKTLNRFRKGTPPPGVGPAAKQHGRTEKKNP